MDCNIDQPSDYGHDPTNKKSILSDDLSILLEYNAYMKFMKFTEYNEKAAMMFLLWKSFGCSISEEDIYELNKENTEKKVVSKMDTFNAPIHDIIEKTRDSIISSIDGKNKNNKDFNVFDLGHVAKARRKNEK